MRKARALSCRLPAKALVRTRQVAGRFQIEPVEDERGREDASVRAPLAHVAARGRGVLAPPRGRARPPPRVAESCRKNQLIPVEDEPEAIALTAVNRCGNAGPSTVLEPAQTK